ncbi:proline racemase family protein [Saxibacter everestensis]|uniref:Proline racemase family protein n=1 Tax=Saxibacter everestensis TaxID=2909229 RepID=A0ABY8QTE1_9MICO|nr:proline racemase family protein [Brevibacteriaceae bacterium ZFBP1038]
MTETYSTVDYHTGGEPFRIVTAGAPDIPGATVAERRMNAIDDDVIQRTRKVLCSEPRGHADMYGGFLTPPDDDGADFGVLFWHKDGFSTACGHGTIALGVWAVESGRVSADPDGSTDVVIDVPSGRVTARVTCLGGQVESVAFVNVPSWVVARDVPVATLRGDLSVDVSFGGAIYASLPASAVGLSVTPEDYPELIRIGREIKHLLNSHEVARHPDDERLSGIYGTILYDDFSADGVVHQRNVTVFADGEVDRSPCGSGTCARLALLTDAGTLAPGEQLVHDSIVGSRFLGRVLSGGRAQAGAATTDARVAEPVIPEVVGMAYRTGESTFSVDPRDSITPGFVLR